MVRNQNKKVTLGCSQCCMQNTQTQKRPGPFDAHGPQWNKTRSNCSVFHLLCTAFIPLTRSSTSGITSIQTASENVPLLPVQNASGCTTNANSTHHVQRSAAHPLVDKLMCICGVVLSSPASILCICRGSYSSGSRGILSAST